MAKTPRRQNAAVAVIAFVLGYFVSANQSGFSFYLNQANNDVGTGRCVCQCNCPDTVAPDDVNTSIPCPESNTNAAKTNSPWDVQPLQHTKHVQVFKDGLTTDAFNPFYNYFSKLELVQDNNFFPELPLMHSWPHYFEAYHNHFSRFRFTNEEEVVFMEVGVQSGGKIGVLRDYFGPKFKYVGIDINPSTRMFANDDWAHIEIGDSGNPEFWKGIKEKYPRVDIFLDDGGHTMQQQRLALEVMLPHVHPEGVYMCEDLSTSWGAGFGGIHTKDHRDPAFTDTTMVGLIHNTLDWFMAGFIGGGVMRQTNVPDDFFSESWWRVVPDTVKHIHYYNQIVVYEKGITYQPKAYKTVGKFIPIKDSGEHEKENWDPILKKISSYTGSKWDW